MRTGKLEGFIDNLWQVCYDSGELAAAVTSLSITGLNGDKDMQYRLIARTINAYNGAASIGMTFNADTGSNYGRQYLSGAGAVVGSARSVGASIPIHVATAVNNISFCDILLHAKSGVVRTGVKQLVYGVSGTTVGGVVYDGLSWNNSVDNITQIVLTASQANGIGIGSRFILLKKVNEPAKTRTGALTILGAVKGAWQEVYKTTLAAAATSVTILGLKGNTDVLYRLRFRVKNGYNGDCGFGVRPNNDSGNNYGYQVLLGNVAGAAAAGAVLSSFASPGVDMDALGKVSASEALIYAKSGYARTCLQSVSGGTSGAAVGGAYCMGRSWSNTADEITQFVLFASQADGFGIGTEIVLEKLNL